ncbi:MAG: hypothetical protein GEV10_29375 [Streptosporangiales bacterium]|nr:hypothetical protein [Streptosporangiales bacterium]
MTGGAIDLDPAAVLAEGRKCRTVGDVDVPPGKSALAGGWVPRGLACTNAYISCHVSWQGVFGDLQTTLGSVGDKLQVTANTVGSTDHANVTEFEGAYPRDEIPDPTYDPSGSSAGSAR